MLQMFSSSPLWTSGRPSVASGRVALRAHLVGSPSFGLRVPRAVYVFVPELEDTKGSEGELVSILILAAFSSPLGTQSYPLASTNQDHVQQTSVPWAYPVLRIGRQISAFPL